MPTLMRFLVTMGILAAVVFGGLYVLANYFEPAPKPTSVSVPGVKIRR
ncbi:MAG TPA: hypothetical protein VG900_03895 [Hyphomicrobiaceae bacterium]|jgi:hypothetical protein|nr:hypothetical protein [Hyphomicrobiaceae bacterium]